MQTLDTVDRKLMEEIINLGYQHAATSFSSLTGQSVSVNKTTIEFCSNYDCRSRDFSNLINLTVLQTDIIGELKGASYLIFSEDEKKTVSQMSLMAFGGSARIQESAILAEIDNIISAAVITELSNALQISIYGDVPRLLELDNIDDLQQHINHGDDNYCLIAHTNFIFDSHVMISPFFIWKIDRKIMSLIGS